jgi:pyrimidine-specific ribonucleoside hydrolase
VQIFIDCDPGHDDVLAILLALAHPDQLNIQGITTVAGNSTVENVTDNIRKVLDYLGYSIPVAMGTARPLRREPEPQPMAHGISGMDGPNLPAATSKVEARGAVEFLHEEIMRQTEPVVLVTLAPLTNIALLLEHYPEVKAKISRIAMMGGSLDGGNILPRSEFNIYHDPEAAKIVFHSGIPITMSGLEVCAEAKTMLSDFVPLQYGGRVSRLAYELMDFYCGYARERNWDHTNVFDAVPIAQLLQPELFSGAEYRVDIETEGNLCRGMTVAIRGEFTPPKSSVFVLEHADGSRFSALMLDALRILDKTQPD